MRLTDGSSMGLLVAWDPVAVRSALDGIGRAVRRVACPHARWRLAREVRTSVCPIRSMLLAHCRLYTLLLLTCSRVGVSVLANLGMTELVTFSRKEYENLAGTVYEWIYALILRGRRTQYTDLTDMVYDGWRVRAAPVFIATHADVHRALQRKLREEALQEPLFDTAAHVQALEASQRAMYGLYLAGASPHHIIAAGGR